MFGRKREDEQTRGQLVRAELGESWDHALRAAGHAASGVRTTVGPKVAPAAVRVRSAATNGWGSTKAAFAPLGEAAQGKVRKAQGSKAAGRRWPKVAGLLASGALVGGAAAFILRRRRQQQWDEYDPTTAVSEAAESPESVAAPESTGPGEPGLGEQLSELGEEQPVSDNRRI